MHEEDMAMLKSLAVVAWADGRMAAEEKAHLEALISAFGAQPPEADEVRAFAATPRTLADIPLSELSAGDRRTLLNHAVVLTYVDGEQTPAEKELIQALAGYLRIPESESGMIVAAAEARARRLLEVAT